LPQAGQQRCRTFNLPILPNCPIETNHFFRFFGFYQTARCDWRLWQDERAKLDFCRKSGPLALTGTGRCDIEFGGWARTFKDNKDDEKRFVVVVGVEDACAACGRLVFVDRVNRERE
jgi:hypothetical protein